VTGRDPVWYGAAHYTGEWPGDRESARTAAGHNWEPELIEAYAVTDGPGGFHATPIPGARAVRRSDSKEILGVSSSTRETIGISDMYDLVEALVDQPGIRYEAGGQMSGGRTVWVMARMEPPAQIHGDPSRSYHRLTVVNRLVGPGACSLEWTAVREASQSSISLAELSGQPPLRFQLRHTKNWRQRVKEIEQAVTGVRKWTDEWQKHVDYLASQPITEDQRRSFLVQFVPMPPEGAISDQVKANVLADRAKVGHIMESRTCEGVNGTAWGLVLAAAEYLDHERFYRSAETHFKRCLLRPEPLKRKAAEIARRLVA
jgi:phage/plasmid-like protein (TIGR03299 family)